jgi:3-dehydroquinate synthase
MKTVKLKTSQNSYEIFVGAGLLLQTGDLMREAGISGTKAVIVTDTTIDNFHGETVRASLESAGFQVMTVTIPPGEEQKSINTAVMLYEKLTGFYAERSTPLVALGGGVIGDLTGFAAATYMRGVPLVQVPTTLLAQGDSSIGGKTGVNHGNLKNRIGVFYHPKLTISDVAVLKTMTKRELSNGLSEIIKHGVILDAGLFRYLEKNMETICQCDDTTLEYIVARSAAIKAGVVGQDEYDLGMRNILNCGHTIGHAIESVSGLTVWHGEAVAIGLSTEAKLAHELGILSSKDMGRLRKLLLAAGLPCDMPELDPERLFEAMKHDKKNTDGRIRFALPCSIGASFLTDDINPELIKKVLVM